MTIKLLLTPTQNGYSVTAQGPSANMLDGARSALDKEPETVFTTTLQWSLRADAYIYMRSFYRTGIKNGAHCFLIDLLTYDDILSQHLARFMSWRLQSVENGWFKVVADVEAFPT